MDRKFLIEQLTKQELNWFYDIGLIEDVTEFFANGGFNSWTDEQLTNKYNRDILEEAV